MFARALPKADVSLPSLRMMTPRTVASSSRSHIVMTPRATPSAFDRPLMPSSGKPSSLKVVSGPSKSAKGQNLFQEGYSDRAADRRSEEDGDGEGRERRGIDVRELDRRRRELAEAREEQGREDSKEPVTAESFSPFARQILVQMRLLEEDKITSSQMWEPGRALLHFDAVKYGIGQVQTQIRSKAEIDALGVGERLRDHRQKQVDDSILAAVRHALNPDLHVHVEEKVTADVFEDDMFADDAMIRETTGSHKHRDRLSRTTKKEPEHTDDVEMPVSVQRVLEGLDHKKKDVNGSDSEEFFETNPEKDDYAECFPGVFESAGFEYDSEGEDDDRAALGKKRAALMDSKKAKRKFDRESSQVEKLLKDKFGD